MKRVFAIATLALAVLAAACASSFAMSEAEYKRSLEKYPEFAQAEQELAEAWGRFKAVAAKPHYETMLQEQRNWIRHQDDLIAEKTSGGESFGRAAAEVVRTRTAILNSCVLAYDPNWVSVEMKPTPDRENGCVDFIPTPSRPTDMLPYEGTFFGSTRYRAVERFIVREFDERLEDAPTRFAYRYPYDPEHEPYDYTCEPMYIDEFQFGPYESFRVEFENDRMSCISHFVMAAHGDCAYMANVMPTIIYDARRDRFIGVGDLFENRGLAEVILADILHANIGAVRRTLYPDRDDITQEDIERILRTFCLDKLHVGKAGFVVDLRCLEYYRKTSKRPDDYTVVIKYGEFEDAGLDMSYFK